MKLRVDKEEKREINIKIAVCCSRSERHNVCQKGAQVGAESLSKCRGLSRPDLLRGVAVQFIVGPVGE